MFVDDLIIVATGKEYGEDSSSTDVIGLQDIGDLDDGAIGAFGTKDYGLISGSAPAIAALNDTIIFALGRGTRASQKSQPIDRVSFAYHKEAYAAPVAEIQYLGGDNNTSAKTSGAIVEDVEYLLSGASSSNDFSNVATYYTYNGIKSLTSTNTPNGSYIKPDIAGTPTNYDSGTLTPTGSTALINLPGSLIVGTVAEVIIVNKDTPYYDRERKRRYYRVIATGETNQIALEALVTDINADSKAFVTAATAGTDKGIKLTADTAGLSFSVLGADIISTASVLKDDTGLSVKNVVGSGTPTQLTEIESAVAPAHGKTGTNRPITDMYNFPTRVVSGATYTIYTLTWKNDGKKQLTNSNADLQSLAIAVPSGYTNTITALDNILAVI